MDERDAIRILQQGDIAGLEALVRAYQLPAVRAAYLITQDRPLAEEVVQTAFVRAYERIGQFDPRYPFGPWFLKGVVRDAAKASARRHREPPLVGASDPLLMTQLLADPASLPEEAVAQQETRDAVWAALEQLAPPQRLAIVQRYYLGLTEVEMAEAQQIPQGTVKWRLSAARTRLRGLLRPLQEGG